MSRYKLVDLLLKRCVGDFVRAGFESNDLHNVVPGLAGGTDQQLAGDGLSDCDALIVSFATVQLELGAIGNLCVDVHD